MSGLSRTPGKRVYDENRTVGSNPTLSANKNAARSGCFLLAQQGVGTTQRLILEGLQLCLPGIRQHAGQPRLVLGLKTA